MSDSQAIEWQRFDWPTIRMEYVEGYVEDGERIWPTFADLGRRYDLRAQLVQRRGNTEDWKRLRTQHIDEVEQARRRARVEQRAKDAAELDHLAFQIAHSGMKLTAQRLRQLEVIAKLRDVNPDDPNPLDGLVPDDEGAYDEVMLAVFAERSLKALGEAANTFFTLGGKALGLQEVQRLELSGPGGGPVQVEERLSIGEQLSTGDPRQLHELITAFERAAPYMPGLPTAPDDDSDEILDAEIVDD